MLTRKFPPCGFSSSSSGLRFSIVAFFFFVLSALVILPNSFAAQLRIAWDPNTEGDLAGYKVFCGTAPRNYGTPIKVGNVTSHTVTGLMAGQIYYLAVRAYDSSGNESGFSNEASGAAVEPNEPNQSLSFRVQTNPPGISFVVDGTTYSSAQTFNWAAGSSHDLSVVSPQGGSGGTRYVFAKWSDGGAQSHKITTPAANATYTANFTTQYSLTTGVRPTGAGTVTPSGTSWYNSGQNVSLRAIANSSYKFSGWSGSLSGSSSSASIVMNAAKNLTANLSPLSRPNSRKKILDFDQDGKTDLTIWRPNGDWCVRPSSGEASWVANWGQAGDIPVPGDYDGDGETDLAVYRPSTGFWHRALSSGGTIVSQWGGPSFVPVPGDYDGDGKTDVAVYQPSDGSWHRALSSGGTIVSGWGGPSFVPVPGDYDGDGKTDVAVYQPTDGAWYLALSSGGTIVTQWGGPDFVPVPGDYDGDGKTDVAVYQPADGTWHRVLSSGGTIVSQWGGPDFVPVPGDYDGDGRADVAVYQPADGTWYLAPSSGGTITAAQGGSIRDLPLTF